MSTTSILLFKSLVKTSPAVNPQRGSFLSSRCHSTDYAIKNGFSCWPEKYVFTVEHLQSADKHKKEIKITRNPTLPM